LKDEEVPTDKNQNLKTEYDEEISGRLTKNNQFVSAEDMRQSKLVFLDSYKKYKQNLINRLRESRSQILKSQVDMSNAEQARMYKSSLNQVENLIASSYRDIATLNEASENHILEIIKSE